MLWGGDGGVCRMTLLLGPPGSGKTSLLLALAGKLDKALEASGTVTYNGHGMKEFVPERTCAYISQRDLQMGELTVRETLDFSGRCQGVGPRFGMHSLGLTLTTCHRNDSFPSSWTISPFRCLEMWKISV